MKIQVCFTYANQKHCPSEIKKKRLYEFYEMYACYWIYLIWDNKYIWQWKVVLNFRFSKLFYNLKPLDSRHLWDQVNMSVIEKCSLYIDYLSKPISLYIYSLSKPRSLYIESLSKPRSLYINSLSKPRSLYI